MKPLNEVLPAEGGHVPDRARPIKKIPIVDQLFLVSAIRRLDLEEFRDHCRRHMPQFANLESDKLYAMMHAARCLDPYCGAKLKIESENYLRQRNMTVPMPQPSNIPS